MTIAVSIAAFAHPSHSHLVDISSSSNTLLPTVPGISYAESGKTAMPVNCAIPSKLPHGKSCTLPRNTLPSQML
ncbi:hypothetical protein PGTUg99_031416 [Puccinia graminis f. sp. tritici]|uniref:Uncharacterized protein n=1 Tax=Puccinia graminis f. sp. tritici TaxID=56615 RepID=A0A5B0SKK5_PUCGR|nr:hypothetical protein PGTUg99_031416 [Puccinia graminis f. sp. tritici]